MPHCTDAAAMLMLLLFDVAVSCYADAIYAADTPVAA